MGRLGSLVARAMLNCRQLCVRMPTVERPRVSIEHGPQGQHPPRSPSSFIESCISVEQLDPNVHRSDKLMRGRKSMDAVFGGQVIGQSLNAASSTVEPQFLPHSLHSYFIKAGTVKAPILYFTERIRDGRSFCTRYVKAIQNGEVIFTAQISFHKTEPESIQHGHPLPKVAQPEDLRDLHGLLIETLADKHSKLDAVHRAILKHKLAELPPAFSEVFEARPVDPDRYLFQSPDPTVDSNFQVWLRAKHTLGENYCLQRCLAAYLSDTMMMETSLLPHLQNKFIPSMVFSLDHSVWYHRPEFRVDNWMLFEVHSPCAARSRAFSTARLWNRDGLLVMSVAQEGLVRSRL